jgi:hemolysin activation/secretion protein
MIRGWSGLFLGANLLPSITLTLLFTCLNPRVLAENNRLSFDRNLIAQLPNPITPETPEIPIKIPQPLPESPLDFKTPELPSSPESPNLAQTIVIKEFQFEGNTESLVSDEQLTEKVKDFLNREVTFNELLTIESIVTQEYIDRGYINSGATIPAEQTFDRDRAIIKVQIIEGGIETIEVKGTRRLSPDYIRSRLQLASSRPLNKNNLLQALQLLQLNPLIKSIAAELSTGSLPELSLLSVTIEEADSFSLEAFVNNGRAPSVGTIRRGGRIKEGNLLGFGDALNIEYANTEGSNAIDLSYNIPINPRNGSLLFKGGISDTEVIEPPFNIADIKGDSFYLEISYRQPLLETPTEEFALGLTLSRQESQTQLLGENFPLSPGADNNGETRISALRFFQEWTTRNPQEVFALRSQFSLGLNLFDASVNEETPDSRFFAWRGQGQYVRLLGADTLFVLRSDLQLATTTLVPLEQFGIGGLQSVRGYRQDLLLTDNGFLASAEILLPLLKDENTGGVLHLIPFLDFGVGWNNGENADPNRNSVVSLGLGLQWRVNDKFSARFDWGIPLTDVNSRNKTLQEQGLYFSVNCTLF